MVNGKIKGWWSISVKNEVLKELDKLKDELRDKIEEFGLNKEKISYNDVINFLVKQYRDKKRI